MGGVVPRVSPVDRGKRYEGFDGSGHKSCGEGGAAGVSGLPSTTVAGVARGQPFCTTVVMCDVRWETDPKNSTS